MTFPVADPVSLTFSDANRVLEPFLMEHQFANLSRWGIGRVCPTFFDFCRRKSFSRFLVLDATQYDSNQFGATNEPLPSAKPSARKSDSTFAPIDSAVGFGQWRWSTSARVVIGGFANVDLDGWDDDFEFIVGSSRFGHSHLAAFFLSPNVAKVLLVDVAMRCYF
jgi:hypothetical protein